MTGRRFSAVGPLCLVVLALSDASLLRSQSGPPAPAPPADGRNENVYVGPTASDRNIVKKFVANVLLDQKAIWTSPAHIDHSSAKWWIFTGVTTAGLLAADHRISQEVPFSGTGNQVGTDASRIGQWYTVFPVAAAFYGAGLAVHNEKLEETGILAGEALVDADVVAEVGKLVARRQRPGDGDHGGHFEKGGSSFPSGHSTQAWALATVIASEYGDHKWVPYVSYAYASLVSSSRIVAQEHFTSDVFVGGAIGFFVGRYVVRTQQRYREQPSGLRSKILSPMVMPSFTSDAQTIAFFWGK